MFYMIDWRLLVVELSFCLTAAHLEKGLRVFERHGMSVCACESMERCSGSS